MVANMVEGCYIFGGQLLGLDDGARGYIMENRCRVSLEPDLRGFLKNRGYSMLRYTVLVISLGIAAEVVWSTIKDLSSTGFPSVSYQKWIIFLIGLITVIALYLSYRNDPKKPSKLAFGSRENILKWQTRGKFKFYGVFLIPIVSFYISLFRILVFFLVSLFPKDPVHIIFAHLYVVFLGSITGITVTILSRKAVVKYRPDEVDTN